jgi:hypothetical protein
MEELNKRFIRTSYLFLISSLDTGVISYAAVKNRNVDSGVTNKAYREVSYLFELTFALVLIF